MRCIFSHLSITLILLAWTASLAADPPTRPPMLTTWGEKLLADRRAGHAQSPHGEHPRPTLRRERWQTLNGPWELFVPGNETPRTVFVPFPVESTLSGIGEPLREMTYRRRFSIPNEWRGMRILLHFEAVDDEATVWVNGRQLGKHRGGYTPFTFDITEAAPFLAADSDNRTVHLLEVHVVDPCDAGGQMRGKQSREPGGIWYTGASGIWQTVWLEAVPSSYIADLEFDVSPDAAGVTVRPNIVAPKPNLFLATEIYSAGRKVAETYGGLDGPLRMTIPESQRHLWSPERPHLYDVHVRLFEGETVVDDLQSYFTLRTLALRPDAVGRQRLFLNERPFFLQAVIDQGYWPDGVYTPPGDAAVETEIRTAKLLGFNTIRKHAKLESRRWYYWCDVVGMLVWQDVPSAGNHTAASRERFGRELLEILESRRHHPSLAVWTLFNEGRGQHRTDAYVELLRQHDPGRLIDAASGWNDTGTGDFQDVHKFPGPEMPAEPDPRRAAVLGSFGGITLLVPGRTWTTESWGHRHVADSETLLAEYARLYAALPPLIERGLVGAAFHQLVDVESECNGLITYDRRHLKVPPEKIHDINATFSPPGRTAPAPVTNE